MSMTLQQMEALSVDLRDRVEDLERRAIPDSIAVPNVYEISATGATIREKETGALETFLDTFDSESSYANYEASHSYWESGPRGPLSSYTRILPEGGLEFTSNLVGEHTSSPQLLLSYRDEGGKGRCQAAIQRLRFSVQEGLAAQYLGVILKQVSPKYQQLKIYEQNLTPPKTNNIMRIYRWYNSVEKVQKDEAEDAKAAAAATKYSEVTFVVAINEAYSVESYAVWNGHNPLIEREASAEGFEANTMMGGGLIGAGGNRNSYPGMAMGFPFDVGFYVQAVKAGTIIHEYEVIPLSWR